MKNALDILIFGASYGSLLATKLLLGGHNVKLVCTPAEAELFNKEGAIVRMPVKGREGLVEVHSRKLPGKLSACSPSEASLAGHDLVEQFAHAGGAVLRLLHRQRDQVIVGWIGGVGAAGGEFARQLA